jgi:hypothetical protein
MQDLLYLFLFIELVLTLLTREFLLITRTVLHILNKKVFRSIWLCNIISIYDWEYFRQSHRYNNNRGEVGNVLLTHRVCRISGREEVEQLPRFNGNSTFKKIK